MANKMLIDATHPEETRVVVLRGNRVEEFDFESAQRKQLRGNIYLAKVTRVEPSLQAAFVDYGGNRHGFLAFSEIHPDYYQIPVADRQALIDEEQRAQRAADDEIDRRSRRRGGQPRYSESRRHDDDRVRGAVSDETAGDAGATESAPPDEEAGRTEAIATGEEVAANREPATPADGEPPSTAEPFETEPGEPYPSTAEETAEAMSQTEQSQPELPQPEPVRSEPKASEPAEPEELQPNTASPATAPFEVSADATGETAADSGDRGPIAPEFVEEGRSAHGRDHVDPENGDNGEDIVESVGGADALEEVPDRALRNRRQYKIQEVIKRRQVMLVQVVKEERGSKGAALTTYLSLAGRYSVLMPNTARGGGISRKITSLEDRSRLKEIAQELEVPEGMGVILRTAGASRTKAEIKRDFEYLLRLWETVRDLTLKSTAPKLVYEEGSLVKRSIRDLYSKDIDEITVAGSEAYQEAKDFMRMLMPSHAKNVRPYTETQPLLSRYGVENQLDAMFSPVVQLRSGGYIVINQAEALVAIDVNSGRATREHHIEDTALKTNLEAADEIARQLRLRDLAGLIVIDFIDMDEKRNNRAVERRLKECLKQDRARIQVGRISHFGLLEMSRQRIRASVLESSTEKCPYCGGSGHVRSVSSLALQVLRALEEQLMRGATHNLIARTRPDVALYVLNQKRAHLRSLEERFAITITISADESVAAPQAFVIDRGDQVHTVEEARALADKPQPVAAPLEEEDDLEEADGSGTEQRDTQVGEAGSEQREGGARQRRRRRRGRGRGRENGESGEAMHAQEPAAEDAGESEAPSFAVAEDETATSDEGAAAASPDERQPHEHQDHGEPQGDRRRRRRGRRGGRRNRHERERNGEAGQDAEPHPMQTPAEFAPDAFVQPDEPKSEPDHAIAERDASTPEAVSAPPRASDAAPSDVAALPPTPASEPDSAGPRRRSTVREPAPVSGTSDESVPASHPATPPAPETVITESDKSESADRPRRTGWWSRRSAGG